MIVKCPRCQQDLDCSEFSSFSYHRLDCTDTGDLSVLTRFRRENPQVDDVALCEWIERGGDIMGLDDFLKGMKPEENDVFDVLAGLYEVAVDSLTIGTKRDSTDEQYTLELSVVEVLDGNGSVGRKLWSRYPKTEDGIKRLVDDLFTAGIETNRADGLAAFEATFPDLKGTHLFIRAWGWTPDKDRSGQPLADSEKRTYQQMAVVSEKRVKKLIEKKGVVSPF